MFTHDTAENFSNLQVNHGLGGEEDGGKSDNQGKARHHRVTVTKTFRNPTIDKKTNNFAHIGTL